MERGKTFLVTGKVRLCYLKVHEPDEDGKYSCAILIPKSDKATIAKVNAAVEAAKEVGKEKKWGGKLPKTLKLPLRDGDDEDKAEYEGCMFFNASTNSKPELVTKKGEFITSKEDLYSGAYARVSINMYPFDVDGNRGIGAGLGNIQKLDDGEKLSGGSTAAQDFGDDFEDDEDDDFLN
jgi:hypothetical protein